jgi:hypothetical protein
MFLSFHHFGSVERSQALQKCLAALARSRTRLAANFTNVLIPIRRRRVGAKRQSPKASIDEVGFRGRQLASTPANQYSVLVIHVFLLSLFQVRSSGPKSLKSRLGCLGLKNDGAG